MYFYKRSVIQNKSTYNSIVNLELYNDDYYSKIVEKVPTNNRSGSGYNYNHEDCLFKTEKVTEKRLCHCLVNFDKTRAQCEKCALKTNMYFAKKILNGTMIDFEIPVSRDSTDSIGEIDLIFEYSDSGVRYLAEFKPLWNTESLLRMVAEILTYTYVLEKDNKAFIEKYGKCKKAILFVKGSEQWKQWTYTTQEYKYSACERLREIIKKEQIAVFCLDLKEKGYFIEKLN